ncbi:MAG: hypothetical protein R2827_03840 [Bdellovibrionales bacterium]
MFRAYSLLWVRQGWKTRILSIAEGNQGGLKEVVAEEFQGIAFIPR